MYVSFLRGASVSSRRAVSDGGDGGDGVGELHFMLMLMLIGSCIAAGSGEADELQDIWHRSNQKFKSRESFTTITND